MDFVLPSILIALQCSLLSERRAFNLRFDFFQSSEFQGFRAIELPVREFGVSWHFSTSVLSVKGEAVLM